jgi:predicted extracellular nuclease
MRRVHIGVALAASILLVPFARSSAELFFSEYVEGTSNNKAIEIYNPFSGPVDLSAYVIERYSNGASTPSATIALEGVLPADEVWVVANPMASLLLVADQFSSAINFNGDDALALVRSGVVLDVFGQIGFDPGIEWLGSDGITSTQDDTLRRRVDVMGGDPNGADAFDPSLEWTRHGLDVFSDLGSHVYEFFPIPEPEAWALALCAAAALRETRRVRRATPQS